MTKKLLFFLIFAIQLVIGQEVKVIDNKGSISTVNNNSVNTSNTAPLLPVEGDVWFDNTDPVNVITKIWDGSAWVSIEIQNKTLILNRDGGSLPTATNTFFDLPLNATHIQSINSNFYSVTGTAQITILQSGNYMISGELSTTNMPAGDTKYILALFINGVRRGYLSRGSASLPSQDFWGTTGVIMYPLLANDVVTIEYVLNAGGSTLNANFSNIGITKL